MWSDSDDYLRDSGVLNLHRHGLDQSILIPGSGIE